MSLLKQRPFLSLAGLTFDNKLIDLALFFLQFGLIILGLLLEFSLKQLALIFILNQMRGGFLLFFLMMCRRNLDLSLRLPAYLADLLLQELNSPLLLLNHFFLLAQRLVDPQLLL